MSDYKSDVEKYAQMNLQMKPNDILIIKGDIKIINQKSCLECFHKRDVLTTEEVPKRRQKDKD